MALDFVIYISLVTITNFSLKYTKAYSLFSRLYYFIYFFFCSLTDRALLILWTLNYPAYSIAGILAMSCSQEVPLTGHSVNISHKHICMFTILYLFFILVCTAVAEIGNGFSSA